MPDNVPLIGKILEKYCLVTLEEFDAVAQAYDKMEGQLSMGELLQDQGYLTPEQVIWLGQAVRHYEARVLARSQSVQEGRSQSTPTGQQPAGPSDTAAAASTPLTSSGSGSFEQEHTEPRGGLSGATPQPVPARAPQPPAAPSVEEPPRRQQRESQGPVSRPGGPVRGVPIGILKNRRSRDGDSQPSSGPAATTAVQVTAQAQQPVEPLRPAAPADAPAPTPASASALVLALPEIELLPITDQPASPAVHAPPSPQQHSLSALLQEAALLRASDLHLHIGAPPLFRVDGDLVQRAALAGAGPAPRPLTTADTARIIESMLSPDRLRVLRVQGDLVFAHTDGALRLRVSAVRHRRGVDLVLRLLPGAPPTLDEVALGLPPALETLAGISGGLILCTGPAGSGKTTTQAALIERVRQRRRGRVLLLADPVEIVHQQGPALLQQRQISAEALPRALETALTEGWTVLGLSDLRSSEVAAQALCAAEAGALVLATLPAPSAGLAVARLLGLWPAAQRSWACAALAGVLRAVVCQRLARRASGAGRLAAVEVLLGGGATAALIEQDRLEELPAEVRRQRALGLQPLDEALEGLERAGLVAPAAARAQRSGLRP